LAHKVRPGRREIPEQQAPQVHKDPRGRKGLKVRRDLRGHKVRRVTRALKARRVIRERPVGKEIPGQLAPQVHKAPKETLAPQVRRDPRGFRDCRATSVLRVQKVIAGRPVVRAYRGRKGNPAHRDLLDRAVADLTESWNMLRTDSS